MRWKRKQSGEEARWKRFVWPVETSDKTFHTPWYWRTLSKERATQCLADDLKTTQRKLKKWGSWNSIKDGLLYGGVNYLLLDYLTTASQQSRDARLAGADEFVMPGLEVLIDQPDIFVTGLGVGMGLIFGVASYVHREPTFFAKYWTRKKKVEAMPDDTPATPEAVVPAAPAGFPNARTDLYF